MSIRTDYDAGSNIHGDSAPGWESETREGVQAAVRGYLLGLALATLLTVASFWAARMLSMSC